MTDSFRTTIAGLGATVEPFEEYTAAVDDMKAGWIDPRIERAKPFDSTELKVAYMLSMAVVATEAEVRQLSLELAE